MLAIVSDERTYENKERINLEEKNIYILQYLFFMKKMDKNMLLFSNDQVLKGKINLNIFIFTAISTISIFTKASKLLIRH